MIHDAILCHLSIIRSLISKAMRKKYFYKETIKIDRLLPNEQLDSTKYKLGDWIGWDPTSFKGDLQSLGTNLEPPPNKDELLGSAINTKVLCEKRCDADMSPCAERLEQSTGDSEMAVETQEETSQANRSEACNAAIQTILDKSVNDEIIMAHSTQACVASSVDKTCIDEHVEFVQDAMELDATESYTLNLIAGDSASLSSDVKLACSSLPQTMELFDTTPEDKGPDQTSDMVDYARADARYGTSCTSVEMEDPAPLDHEIPSCSDVCLKNKGLDKPDDVSIDPKDQRGTAESLGCSPVVEDEETPLNPAVLLSTDLCKDIVPPVEQVMTENIEQNLAVNIEHTMSYKAEPVNSQETSSAAFVCDKGSSDRTRENNELKEQNSKKPNACLEKDVAKIHEKPLKFSCASSKVEISTARSGDMIYLSLIALFI